MVLCHIHPESVPKYTQARSVCRFSRSFHAIVWSWPTRVWKQLFKSSHTLFVQGLSDNVTSYMFHGSAGNDSGVCLNLSQSPLWHRCDIVTLWFSYSFFTCFICRYVSTTDYQLISSLFLYFQVQIKQEI